MIPMCMRFLPYPKYKPFEDGEYLVTVKNTLNKRVFRKVEYWYQGKWMGPKWDVVWAFCRMPDPFVPAGRNRKEPTDSE